MNKYVFNTRYGTFERVQKRKAVSLFVNQHKDIYIVANKCRCDYTHPLTYPYCIHYDVAKENTIDDIGIANWFKNIVNSVKYYNCNYECGYDVAYYVKTDIGINDI